MPPMDQMGDRIAAARRRAAKTQSELARDINSDVGTVSRYERGATKPSVDALVQIARACRCSVDWLATGEGDVPMERAPAATGTDAE